MTFRTNIRLPPKCSFRMHCSWLAPSCPVKLPRVSRLLICKLNDNKVSNQSSSEILMSEIHSVKEVAFEDHYLLLTTYDLMGILIRHSLCDPISYLFLLPVSIQFVLIAQIKIRSKILPFFTIRDFS